MFNRRTLFVIGAGASKEVGFPVGTELAKRIYDRVAVDDRELGLARVVDRQLFAPFQRKYPNDLTYHRIIQAFKVIRNGIPIISLTPHARDIVSGPA